MSLTKEIIQQENSRTTADRMELHLWKEGTFLRSRSAGFAIRRN